jgi:hypothetical protein
MPIKKVPGGFKWGNHGKTYASRVGAEKQAAAAYASGYKGDPSEKKKTKAKKPSKK